MSRPRRRRPRRASAQPEPRRRFAALLLVIALTGAACATAADDPPPPTRLDQAGPEASSPPPLDGELIAAGEEIYARFCATCHGANGEGSPDWRTPNPDGSYDPPPHDGSGHTWHHSDQLLADLIANGGGLPQTRMPAFGDRLDDEQIVAVLEFIKTWWGVDERAIQWSLTRRDAESGH